MPKIYWDESHRQYEEKKPAEDLAIAKQGTKAKGGDPVEDIPEEPAKEIPHLHEGDILLDKAYSDDPTKLKSLSSIA